MSDEYTPTTEDVQDIYGTHPTHVEEFYRWLNAHDAEVAAKALEDAADDLAKLANITAATSSWMECPNCHRFVLTASIRDHWKVCIR